MTILEQNLGLTTPLWQRRTRRQRATAVVLPLLRRPGFSLALLIVLFSLLAAVAPHWHRTG